MELEKAGSSCYYVERNFENFTMANWVSENPAYRITTVQ
jgi:hypothetical protein